MLLEEINPREPQLRILKTFVYFLVGLFVLILYIISVINSNIRLIKLLLYNRCDTVEDVS